MRDNKFIFIYFFSTWKKDASILSVDDVNNTLDVNNGHVNIQDLI